MRKKWLWKRCASVLLAGALLVSGVEPVMTQAAVSDGLLASRELLLSFEDSVADTSGKSISVEAKGTDHQVKEAVFTEGIHGKALELDGNTYLDLGTSSTLQPAEMTLSFWVKANKTISGENIIMWNKPSGAWNGSGWYLSCLNDSVPLKLSVGSHDDTLTEISVNGSRSEFFPVGEWVNIVVTYSSKTGEAVFYRNGEVCESSPKTCSSKIVANDTDHKYLGFNSPGYNGGYAQLVFDEYEIYSSVADAQDVKELYGRYAVILSDAEITAADYDWLNPFEGKELTAITGSVTLPVKGKNGSTISWASSDEAVVTKTGRVIRPEDEDKEVTLTASIVSGTESKEKAFTFTVKKREPLEVPENLYSAYTNNQFSLDEVAVTDAYYKHAQDADIAFLKKFDNDRILVGFRENAGINTKGAVRYNGWENGLLAGHCVGHYLSAAAQAVLVTGDEELDAKLAEIISGLKECQDNAGSYGGSKPGFLFGANVSDTSNVELQFDVVQGDASGQTWVPWYNMHKLIQGLIDTYKYTGNAEALEVASDLGDWVYNRVSKWTTEQQRRISYTEYGGMNDCMYELYKLTHKEEHKEAAHKFDDPDLYDIILSGDADTLKGRHANTTIPKFVGALNRYVALKEVENADETDYLAYAEDFWTLVVEKHAFITGGTSDMEHFRADNALDEIRTQCNCESCCAHNMLKLSKELFKVTGKKKYADYYENTLRNAIMGAVNEEGAFSYFTPMATGYYKTFGTSDPATNMYWCCTGTGMENYTKLGDSIYFKTENALVVNQYVASEVIWKEKKMKLTQESDVTASDKAKFTVTLLEDTTEVNAELKLRIPDWTTGNITLLVNGQPAEFEAADEYALISRTWKNGDTVELTYPMSVVAYGLPDNAAVYAFKYGPTVLAAKLGKEEWNDTVWAGANLSAPAYKVVGSEKARLQVSYGKTVKQILGTETLAIQGNDTTKEFMKSIASNMEKKEGSLEFCLRGTDAETVFGGEGLTFVPFNTLNDERYGIYWYFESKEDSSEEKILEDKEEGRFAEAIIDSIQPGYQQYEIDAVHQMKETNTVFETGVSGLGSTRSAKADGYFEYNMKVDKSVSNSLLCQFAKADEGKKVKITVGSTVINYTVEKYDGEDVMFKKSFDIPKSEIDAAQTLTVGADTYDIVKVKFESGSTTEASARIVNGLYMMRAYSTDTSFKDIVPSEGRLKSTENVYTLRLPSATERVTIAFSLNDATGLLYVDGTLVNDAKPQVFTLTEKETTIPLKVYAQDHTTCQEYTLQIVCDDGLDSGEEILVNGDIENGTTAWVSHDSATLGLGYSTKYAGENSLKMSDRTKTTSGAAQDITGKVKAGATYEIDGYVIFKQGAGHNDNPPENAVFNVSVLYGEKETREVMVSKQVKLNEWGNLYGDYTIPMDADVSKVSILLETEYKENPTADDLIVFFADNVSMKKIADAPDVDQEAADAVSEMIDAIGTVEYTEESKALIKAARDAFEALTDKQKALVKNADVLQTAEAAYEKFEKEAEEKDNQKAADAVIEKINAIGTVTFTKESKALIEAARTAYNALTEAQKALVKNAAVLTNAEAGYAQLEKDAAANQDANQNQNQNQNQTPEQDVIKEGAVYTVSGYMYKVTSLAKKTVMVTGAVNKKCKTIKVENEVKISGTVFTITAIGNKAFYKNTKLKTAKIGKNVTSIGKSAFEGAKKLKTITINGTKLKSVGKNALKGIDVKAKITVPSKKYAAYRKILKKKGQKSTVKIVKAK